MTFCKDCRHCGAITIASTGSDVTMCLREGQTKPGTSPVTGAPYQEKIRMFCELERLSTSEKSCGPNAQFFEPFLEAA